MKKMMRIGPNAELYDRLSDLGNKRMELQKEIATIEVNMKHCQEEIERIYNERQEKIAERKF